MASKRAQNGQDPPDAAQAAGAHYACDWTRLTLTAPVRRESVLLDPFDDSPTADFRSLMEALQ